MKTEAEIREHRDAMSIGVTPGCRCVHCVGNIVAAGVLSWALGEKENLQPEIDRMNEAYAMKKGGSK